MSRFDSVFDNISMTETEKNSIRDKIAGLYKDQDARNASDTADHAHSSRKKKSNVSRGLKIAAASVAVLAAVTGVCAANPTLASHIPVFRHIFAQVETENTIYQGNYSQKSETASDPAGAYKTRIGDIKIQVREVYSDGSSVYASLKITKKDGGFDRMEGSDLSIFGYQKLDGKKREFSEQLVQGHVVDDNTFIGMTKFDIFRDDLQTATLKLNIYRIKYSEYMDAVKQEDTKQTPGSVDRNGQRAVHTVDIGGYVSDTAAALNVRIPYTVDRKNIQKYKISEKNKNYTIDHITVSDEQVVIYRTGNVDFIIFDQDGKDITLRMTGYPDDAGVAYLLSGTESKKLSSIHVYAFTTDDQGQEKCKEVRNAESGQMEQKAEQLCDKKYVVDTK